MPFQHGGGKARYCSESSAEKGGEKGAGPRSKGEKKKKNYAVLRSVKKKRKHLPTLFAYLGEKN